MKFNISLIGESNVGKTSLVQVLTGNEFSDDMLSTIGIVNIHINKIIEEKNYRFNIFDTAGQEKYNSLSSSTIQIAHGILLVFSVDNKDSFNHIDNWYKVIEECVDPKEKVIYLVGNKNDLENREINENEAKKFADSHNMKYFETSAKTNTGLNEVFDEICLDIYKLDKKLKEEKKRQRENIKLQKEIAKKKQKKKC